MFYLHIVLCNIKRNKWKSMITVGICIFVFLLLNLYLNNIYDCKIQLQNLPNISPVYCRVSNLNGSSEIGLEISEKLITDLESSTKIKDAAFSVRMVAGVGDFLIEDWKEKLNISVAGANSIDAISGISLKNIHIEEDVPNFFTSSKLICIINKFVMEKNNLEVGDMVMLNLYYQYYDEKTRLHYAPLDLTPLEIIGTMIYLVAILIFTKTLVIGLLMVIFLLLFYSHLFINNQKVRTAIERCLGVSKKNSKRSLIFGITLLLFLGSTIGCSMGGFLSRYISAENLNHIYYDSSYSNIADVEIKETILEERENMIVVFITILVSTTFIILLGGLISNYKINQNLKMEPMKLLSEKRNQ